MSPDWAAKVEPVPYAKLDDPQSLNLYAYVGNNPLSRTDADGHIQRDAWNYYEDQIASHPRLLNETWTGTSANETAQEARYSAQVADAFAEAPEQSATPDKKSKVPDHAVIGPHTSATNGASNYYTYYLENAAGKRLKGQGYATEEHIKPLLTEGNVRLKSETSEGKFVPSPSGDITDRVGLTAPLPRSEYYFRLAAQTFTVSYKGQSYDLTTHFIHITAASGGKVSTAAVGVVVP